MEITNKKVLKRSVAEGEGERLNSVDRRSIVAAVHSYIVW